MNNIQVFTNQHFGRVRVVMRDGDPWFVAADVCRALDIINSRHALTRLDEDVKGVVLNDTLGGKQSIAVVNEPGLYALVRIRLPCMPETIPSMRYRKRGCRCFPRATTVCLSGRLKKRYWQRALP